MGVYCWGSDLHQGLHKVRSPFKGHMALCREISHKQATGLTIGPLVGIIREFKKAMELSRSYMLQVCILTGGSTI